ncbi:hypothetical protein FSP39_017208 [Pinctada imbricata]|uniref:SH3 domain-containing protein n=1 Tax=Pinctada imbricata TaxID=66713 RepID=A0AA88Y516_PINIB|nr:hypothetical protein FSP39_017208 [Pinctada imbricata]
MAFLCPSRVGRDIKDRKKKVKASAVLGRITGSDSVDTLVRVGLEKQHGLPADCKLLVIKNFEPLSNDELPVRRGQEVYLLYAENEWYYVINAQGQEGFVPRTFCTTVKSKSKPTKEKERYRRSSGGSSESNLINDSFESSGTYFSDNSENASRFDSGILLSDKNNTSYEASDMYPEVRPFRKTLHGQYIALYDFTGLDENDVTVERAELFDVLNIEDPDWSWIRKYDGQEGFVPKSYICPVEPLRIQERISTLENSAAQIQFHPATPSIRQPLVSHQQLRFQHSTPQPSHKFPLRPSSLAVSKCFSSETNVSDLRKERSALRVHDCSHKERLERNAKARSRSSSPAVSDNTNFRSNSKPFNPSVSPSPAVWSSPATADRSRLKVSSTSLNDEQSHSRSSTPSIKTNGIQGISELVMLYDFTSKDSNSFMVRRGENVYVDNPDQADPHWVWVFHPKSQGYGYVPRDYVKSTMLKTTL